MTAKLGDDPHYNPAGANVRLSAPLSKAKVRQFEKRHQITLPEDYVRFITDVANGAEGARYGVFPLGEMDQRWGFPSWREDDGVIGVLSRPFPHEQAWQRERIWSETSEDEFTRERRQREYWSTELISGAIPLWYRPPERFWLIVTGSEAGTIWIDAREQRGGIRPAYGRQGSRLTFSDWSETVLTGSWEPAAGLML